MEIEGDYLSVGTLEQLQVVWLHIVGGEAAVKWLNAQKMKEVIPTSLGNEWNISDRRMAHYNLLCHRLTFYLCFTATFIYQQIAWVYLLW